MQNFPIGRANDPGIVHRRINGAIRQADIVEHRIQIRSGDQAADLALHAPEDTFRLFYSRANGGSDMKPSYLPGINIRKKIPAHHKRQRE